MDMRADDDDITVSALGNQKYRPPSARAPALHARIRVSAGAATLYLAAGGGHEPDAPGVRVVHQDPSYSCRQQRKTNVTVRDIPLTTLAGQPTSLGDVPGTLLVVNVASKCGLTPQYEGLERLQETYRDRGFSVVGFPCNQFGGQEPGTADEIQEFCSATYGVSFPLLEKIDVKGPGRHPVYEELTAVPDADGEAGDIQWNFEKFLVGPDGAVIARFRPRTDPEDPAVIAAIEANLPG
jgi:glutathione peroxidase